MRWTSGWPSARPPGVRVVGLDIGPDACRLVVLGGSVAEPDKVYCAERLTLPAEWVAHGEVLQPTAFGQWLRAYLKKAASRLSGLMWVWTALVSPTIG